MTAKGRKGEKDQDGATIARLPGWRVVECRHVDTHWWARAEWDRGDPPTTEGPGFGWTAEAPTEADAREAALARAIKSGPKWSRLASDPIAREARR